MDCQEMQEREKTCDIEFFGKFIKSDRTEIVPEITTMKSSQFKASRKYACLCMMNPLATILIIISKRKIAVKAISPIQITCSVLCCHLQFILAEDP